MGELSGDEGLADRGHPGAVRRIRHDHRSVISAEGQVDVAGVPLALVELGHEGERHALLRRDDLRPGLVDDVVIACAEGVSVPKRDLMLAEVALALRALDDHPGLVHLIANPSEEWFDPGAAEHRVVDVVEVRRSEIAVAGVPCLLVGVLEEDELEFSADEGAHAGRLEPVELPAQNLTGRGDDV